MGFNRRWVGSPAYIQVSRGELFLHLSEHHGDCCPGSTVFVWMTGIDEFTNARRHQADSILVDLDLFGDADFH